MEKDINEFLPRNDTWNKKRENGLILTDYQIDVLKRNGIDYMHYGSLKEILFEINEILDEDEDEELECVAREIAEKDYYSHEV